MAKQKRDTTIMTAAGAKYWIYNPEAQQTIVAVHGLRGTHHGLEFIAKQLPQYRWIIPDLPGFGVSSPLDTEHDVPGYSQWLVRFLDDLPIKTPVVLLGHSFGSLVASDFAAKHPSRVAKLILINPISVHGNPLGGLAAKGYYMAAQLLPDRVGEKLLRSKLITRLMTVNMLTTADKNLKKRVYEQHFAYFATFANRVSVHQTFRATMSRSVLEYAHNLSMPTLLIVGTKDTFVPLGGQQKLHQKIDNSQLHAIEGVGHLVHYETPEIAASKIAAFVG